ncbi:Similar to S.cerevisiae protein YPK1 (Serine/threonine protein kinase) [Malassezia sympodialis ATCC 42132]|uniref:non-specific serine/threonine protein kinase n=1 Tax=Malassezia sympodialis (strain ATCC 42132) TaxID=1230383 RepID=A0A1M8A1Q2_MALS4|nr:Similar to S.cerevisiae protein YPK1 (Serine/threonine protein kinase) [Malassezia sympodialis ATCC 42132]
MSWKLGKKLKDSAVFPFGLSSATSSSTTPQPPPPTQPRAAEHESLLSAPSSGTKGPVHTSHADLLTVSVVNARGLSLPPGKLLSPVPALPAPSPPTKAGMRQRQMSLPYVVLEFDKNEVLILGLGGDLSSPQWQFTANFDVSRRVEVTLHVYLRAEMVASGPTATGPAPALLGSVASRELRPKNEMEILGANDVYMGMAKLVPSFDTSRIIDTWLPLSGGTGEIRVQMAFKSQVGKSLSIESFELLKVIGKGSFGKVMQVRKKDTSRIYALKIIRKAHIISRSEVTHTLAERTVLAQVNCPFIVPLKFSFQSPDKLYLGLAFVNGGELFHHLQREGRFSEERSRFYAAELFCALEHLHSFHVIYRDLKPENILLDFTGHIALCDFGLCKLNMGDKETTHTFCGTPEYLAPELLLGRGYTKAVDWWTLGVLLYEMLTGLPPFFSEDVNEMYHKILHEPLMFPADVRPDARDLLARLLQRDPAQRLGSPPGGASDIKTHPFFTKYIDWNLLLAKKVQPPYKPGVASAFDTSNFDPEFTKEPATDSVVDDSHMISAAVQEQFAGFSYTAGPEGASGEGLWS